MEKLEEILIQKKVKLSKNGKICLNDLIEVTKNVTNKKKIHEFAKGGKTYEEDGHLYIGKSMVLEILEKYDTKASKKIFGELGDYDDESYMTSEINSEVSMDESHDGKLEVYDNKINFGDKLFEYKGNKFKFVNIDGNIYFKGKDIAEFLEYKDTKSAIIDHVKEKYKVKLKELFGGGETPPLTYNEKNTIYISEPGLYQLISNSKKKEAEKFQDLVYEEILPSIRKTGGYQIMPKIKLDTSLLTSFYNENDISDFNDMNVDYIGVIGFYNNEILMKYGMSGDVYRREFKEHKNTYGEQFKIIFVGISDNNKKVEDKFKMNIKSKNLDVMLPFKGKQREELFTTGPNFSIDDVKGLMQKLIDENPLQSLKNKDDQIKELKYKMKNEESLVIEKEKTMRAKVLFNMEKEKTRQMTLKYKMFKKKRDIDDISSSDESQNDYYSIYDGLDNYQDEVSKNNKIEYKKDVSGTKYHTTDISCSSSKIGKNNKKEKIKNK